MLSDYGAENLGFPHVECFHIAKCKYRMLQEHGADKGWPAEPGTERGRSRLEMQLRYGPTTQKPDTVAQAKMQPRCGQKMLGQWEPVTMAEKELDTRRLGDRAGA